MEGIIFRIKRYFGWIIGCVGIALAWLSGFDLFEKYTTSQTVISIIANSYVVISFFLFAMFFFYRQYVTIRKEKYANVTHLLHKTLHEIRDLHTFIQMNEPREGNQKEYENFYNQCKIIIGRILDHFNGIFTSITGTRCRSCIKLLYTTDQMYVYTLARDQGSHQSCSQLDTKRVRGNHDPLKDNPQFARLFSDAEDVWHFISNDLTKDHAFHSTSMSAYKPERAHRFPAMLGAWPLPYRSAITAAIRQGPFDLCHERSEVLGFLSVDSESRGVFEERWDVEILFAVADALYHPLRSYLDAQNRPSSPLPIPGPEDV